MCKRPSSQTLGGLLLSRLLTRLFGNKLIERRLIQHYAGMTRDERLQLIS